MQFNLSSPEPEHLLFVVQEAFVVEGRGIILTPGFLREGAPLSTLAGTKLRLHRPNGSDLIVNAFDEALGLNLQNPYFPVFVRGLSKDEAPPGTEVWCTLPSE
ncbi:hypothetical protein [Verrucomicrobium sp. BvORR034]|jgi:hypothetical protein|uniref:hypothetical protein n=1 Tax=Verrucomicrobium sp. BvORR034 TaxID=1396418 RepID=UPI0006796711|nr:hypothetical protein [Verrucomicrobium sp. BvORR034]